MSAARGVPLGERLKAVEQSEVGVSLQALGGAEVNVSRPQLRALVEMYS